MREQFLVEVTDTTAEDMVAAGMDHRTALLELNGWLTAWIETEYHRRIHTETGQAPLDRWDAGWARLGRTAAMPTSEDLTEAFLWSEYRMVTKTATVSLHGNTFEVDAALVGRKVELVFSPFDMETVEVRYRNVSHGKALPHNITRHVHPKARPETPEPAVMPATGIDYLELTERTHHQQLRADRRIGYDALFGDRQGHGEGESGDEVAEQLSITDIAGQSGASA
ncbi:mu transposase, C-terminal family protein [Mycobacterium kansasii]|uniref:Mu transposase, C-terminal family protein n=1 Tax=Mycobacterium kansasii TaxID=1768 RepID=A0A1V3XG25_MYCKA|nr:mu transposase, C-terminal family protein [Mycobacterium kansasii]